MFSLFKKTPKQLGGIIGKFDLFDWWQAEFTDIERSHILKKYRPFGEDAPSPLTELACDASSPRSPLSSMAMWFNNTDDFKIALKIMEKAETYPSANLHIEDAHFGCQERIKFYYRWRDAHEGALSKAIAACEEQVALAPQTAKMFATEERWGWIPRHYGYDQLAIIYEKQGRVRDAIRLCETGQSQGWANEFEKRLARLNKKLKKLDG